MLPYCAVLNSSPFSHFSRKDLFAPQIFAIISTVFNFLSGVKSKRKLKTVLLMAKIWGANRFYARDVKVSVKMHLTSETF